MPDARVNGARLVYEVEGEGPPIVWVSGTGVGHGIWSRDQIPHFHKTYTCLSFDLRGSGESDAPPGPYSVQMFAQDTAELIETVLGSQPVHVVGLSLGSAIIQELALARPDLVRSATLIGTWSSTRREHHIRRWFEARLLALRHAPIEVFQAFAFWMWAPTVVDLEPDLMDELLQFFAENSSAQPGHAYEAHFEADLRHETLDRLGDIRCPTLVICGEEDLITLPRYNQTVAGKIPNARLRIIPKAGHFVWVERGQATNDAIEEFLDSAADG